VTYLRRAIKRRPNLSYWALVAAYAQAGRLQEAVDALKKYQELRGWGAPLNVSTMLKFHPYKHRVDEERFATGLVKAGVPGYYTLTENNKLSGKVIRNLLFGQTISGILIASGKQYWITYAKDGRATYRGGQQGSDMGSMWVDGDQLCIRWDEIRKGHERCANVYRNPDGSREGLDEYILEVPLRVYAWSLTG